MAVDAQHTFNANYAFPPGHLQTAVITTNDVIDQLDQPESRKRMRDSEVQRFPSKIQAIPQHHLHNRLAASSAACSSGRRHVTELDALIHLHSAKVMSELAEIQKRHCAEFLRAYQNQAANKIAERDAEIERLKRKQMGLEATLKQAAAENQTWFTVAKNSESLVAALKSSLDQALRRNAGECHVASAQAEDAESCCYEGAGDDDRRKGRGLCRVCGERNASVLVLPCRHLCLCSECEPVADTCPICYGVKNVGLKVFTE